MEKATHQKIKRFVASALIASSLTALVGATLGPLAALITGAAGFLGVAVASDDELGTCLPLAVFFLMALSILVMALVGVVLLNS